MSRPGVARGQAAAWRTRLARPLLMLAAAPMLMGAVCEEPLVKDSGFDVWCGDHLCQWQVDDGAIAKIPTWHERDYGVELVGPSARISQRLDVSSDDVSCIHFNLLADVHEPVDVVLGLDFDDDGHTDHTETLPVGSWTPLSYHVTAPTYYRGLRIFIQKTGDGHAALAQIQALKSDECSAAPLTTTGRPTGATCEDGGECLTARCLPRTAEEQLIVDPTKTSSLCEGCAADAECGDGAACGLAFATTFAEPFRACLAAASHALGDRCAGGAECATGVCCGGVCSTCCAGAGAACAGAGEVCRQRAAGARPALGRPAWQCSPGEGRGAAGAFCLGDSDCASGRCTGGAPLMVCATAGRRCASGGDCPAAIFDNSCVTAGVSGGRCQ